MSKFIKQIINNVILFGIISHGNFDLIYESNLDYIGYTENALTISKMKIADIEFEDIMLLKTEFGFQFILFTENNSIMEDAESYFYSEKSDNFYNNIYKKEGIQKRRYSDHIDSYNIHIVVRPEIERYRVSIRFESISK